MPIYEYERPDGTTFEIYQGFEDEALAKDPDTGVSVRRVFHAPAVHFKGKGFYNTDYGTRKRQRELATQENGSKPSSESSKGDSKATEGDAKPASKSGGDSSSAPAKAAKGDTGSSAKKSKAASTAK